MRSGASPTRALDLLVALVADEHDVEAGGGEAARLGVDLGDQRAGRVDHVEPRARGACSRTAGETPWAEKITVAPSGTSSSSSTKTAPRCSSVGDDVGVVDDLLAHVDRRAAIARARARRSRPRASTPAHDARGDGEHDLALAERVGPLLDQRRTPGAARGRRVAAPVAVAQRAVQLAAVGVEHDPQRDQRPRAGAPAPARPTPCRRRARRCGAASAGARRDQPLARRRSGDVHAQPAAAQHAGEDRRVGARRSCRVGPRSSLASTMSPGSSVGSSAPQKPAIRTAAAPARRGQPRGAGGAARAHPDPLDVGPRRAGAHGARLERQRREHDVTVPSSAPRAGLVERLRAITAASTAIALRECAPRAPRSAAAWPLRTAPSIVAGQPVSVQAPASTRPGSAVRGPGAQRRAPGRGAERRGVLAGDEELLAPSPRGRPAAARRAPAGSARAAPRRSRRARRRRPTARRRGTGRRVRPEPLGAVEHPLHRRADAGGERMLEHPPVVDDVQVDDRRACRAAPATSRPTPAPCRAAAAPPGRAGPPAIDGVGVERWAAAELDREAVVRRRRDRASRRAAQPHLDAGRASARRAGDVVDLDERHDAPSRCRRPRRRCSRPSLEHLRGLRERRVVGGQVERRARDQLPDRLDRRGAPGRAARSQSPNERASCGRVVGVDAPQRCIAQASRRAARATPRNG